MVNDEQTGDMLTVREIAQLLHVRPNTSRRWNDKGTIRACGISRRGDWRLNREETANFLAESSAQVDKRRETWNR